MLQKLLRPQGLSRIVNSVGSVKSYTNIPIKLVPKRLHDHLFNRKRFEVTQECDQLPSCSGQNGIQEQSDEEDSLNCIELPQLYGQDMMSHFEELGNQQFGKYKTIMDSIIGKDAETVPPLPEEWKMEAGWTAYDPVTGHTESVPFPDEQLLFFDVEICVVDGQLPTIAIALSPTKWYSWCSERLVSGALVPEYPTLEHLIPLEGNQTDLRGSTPLEKVIVGHNIAFDRSRVREQYFKERTATKFWDTMSMSIAVCGMADHQRLIYDQSDASGQDSQAFKEGWINHWRKIVCKNSLESVHFKYCSVSSSLKLDKSLVDMFVRNNIDEIRDNFQALTTYCANDVLATYEIFQKLYPEFRSRFPSAVTYSGMMEMASAFLPINKSWRDFFDKCNKLAAKNRDGVARDLAMCAQSLTAWTESKSYENDPWMWVSDWSTTKSSSSQPNWYLNCFKSKQLSLIQNEDIEAEHMKMLSRDVPRILGLCYGPFPLFYKAAFGWGFLVPKALKPDVPWEETQSVFLKRGDEVSFPNKAILDLIASNRSQNVQEIVLRGNPVASIGIFNFYRLPHPSGQPQNVGSVFSKDFAEVFAEKVLWASRFEFVLNAFVEARSVTRFWSNYKQRYNEQLAVWLDKEATIGAIAPSIIPAGTVTRRAVHKLWLVSANSRKDLIGSDLKSMIQSYQGYNIVGADVDSQEQWIAAMFGDSAFNSGKAGSTPLSNMLLAGNKADQTDLHSVVARQANISRDHAKVLNYARLYGSGESHAREFLKQQGISDKLAEHVTKKLFSSTKGLKQRYFELDPAYNEEFESFLRGACPLPYRNQHRSLNGLYFLPMYLSAELEGYTVENQETHWEQSLFFEEHMARNHGKAPQNFFRNYGGKGLELYNNGFESYTYNYLELKSREERPATPILGCRLSKALEPLPSIIPGAWQFSSRYKRSVINWFVQSSAVDFLHMLLVCMNWLISEYQIDARLMLSIHDEVRYLVKEEDKYRCALALSLSNMYVRSAISSRLGINELPQSVAFFSQVDIDTVLRKEVYTKCVTPLGDEIPAGESVNIYSIVKKTGGRLRKVEPNLGEGITMQSSCRS